MHFRMPLTVKISTVEMPKAKIPTVKLPKTAVKIPKTAVEIPQPKVHDTSSQTEAKQSLFPMHIVGYKSGQFVKWLYKNVIYTCQIKVNDQTASALWAGISDGTLCRLFAICIDIPATKDPAQALAPTKSLKTVRKVDTGLLLAQHAQQTFPILTITSVTAVKDQDVTVEEIIENSNPLSNTFVGQKDGDSKTFVLVARIEKDTTVKVDFPDPDNHLSRVSFYSGYAGQRFEFEAMGPVNPSIKWIACRSCREID